MQGNNPLCSDPKFYHMSTHHGHLQETIGIRNYITTILHLLRLTSSRSVVVMSMVSTRWAWRVCSTLWALVENTLGQWRQTTQPWASSSAPPTTSGCWAARWARRAASEAWFPLHTQQISGRLW